jgi:hypothetical protein
MHCVTVDRGYAVARRRCYDGCTTYLYEAIRRSNEAASRLASKGGNKAFDFGIVMNRSNDRRHLKRASRLLEWRQVI